jgi:hypothetical protein
MTFSLLEAEINKHSQSWLFFLLIGDRSLDDNPAPKLEEFKIIK